MGDEIIVSNNDDFDYICKLTSVDKNLAIAEVVNKEKNHAIPKKQIDLFQALPKREYFEEILTKSTELGVNNIIPFVSKFSVVKDFKAERMQQILLSACKQCERSRPPVLSTILNFDAMLDKLRDYDIIIFANEHEKQPFKWRELKDFDRIALVVGCEAGFSQEEVDKILKVGAKSVSLGERILRCTTATTALLSVVNILSGN